MRRSSIEDFFRSAGRNDRLLVDLRPEADEYARCKKRLGSSCHITIEGTPEYVVSIDDVLMTIDKFRSQVMSRAELDYLVNGLLLDYCNRKLPGVEEALEDLAAILQDGTCADVWTEVNRIAASITSDPQ